MMGRASESGSRFDGVKVRGLLVLLAALRAASLPAQGGVAGQAVVADGSTPPVRWVEREFMMPAAGGLDVLQVEAEMPGRHPLAMLTHGTGASPLEWATVTPWSFLPQAIWFARRGYVVLVVVRKGYGRSGGLLDGTHGGCNSEGDGSFDEAGAAGADDLRAAAAYAAKTLPEVDAGTVVSAGVSSGGFAQVALTAKPPPGLKAAISFAGGRGGDGKGDNCNLDGMVNAFHGFGKKSRVPMLWIYSENDQWFPPPMARSFDAAFKKGGGNDEFVMVPPFSDDGHHFFQDVAGWTPMVEGFLREKGLLPLTELLPEPPTPNVPAPAGLGETGLAGFHTFLMLGPAKAFATNGQGSWGMSMGQWDQATADKKALENCRNAASGGVCEVVSRGR
jgi:dienelactone hydrolase